MGLPTGQRLRSSLHPSGPRPHRFPLSPPTTYRQGTRVGRKMDSGTSDLVGEVRDPESKGEDLLLLVSEALDVKNSLPTPVQVILDDPKPRVPSRETGTTSPSGTSVRRARGVCVVRPPPFPREGVDIHQVDHRGLGERRPRTTTLGGRCDERFPSPDPFSRYLL